MILNASYIRSIPPQMGRPLAIRAAALRFRIRQCLDSGYIAAPDIADRLGIDVQTAYRHLRELRPNENLVRANNKLREKPVRAVDEYFHESLGG